MYANSIQLSYEKKRPEQLFILKREIEKIFGRRIATSRECGELAEEIYHKTSSRINSNTLRRFFGLIKSDYPPSASTINILTEYCGFTSFDELTVIKPLQEANKSSGSLNFFLQYQISLFNDLEINDKNDSIFISFLRLTLKYLNQNPEFAVDFQSVILKSKMGTEFYFEQFVNIDRLNSFYGDGLHCYIEQAGSTDKKTFGHCLLCIRYWLSSNHSLFTEHFSKTQEADLATSTPPFIFGVYYTARLFHAELVGINPESIMVEAYNVHSNFKGDDTAKEIQQSFEYMYCYGLILTGHFAHAMFYINHLLSHYSEPPAGGSNYCYRNLLLLKCIVLARTDKKKEAERIYNLLKPAQFYFLSKKLDTFLYLRLSKRVRKNNANIDTQLLDIIAETGFSRLQGMIAR